MQMNFNPTKSQEFIKKKKKRPIQTIQEECRIQDTVPREGRPPGMHNTSSAEWMLEPHNVILDLHKMMVLLHLAHHVS